MNLIFDLDGTLIDSAPDIRTVANQVLQQRAREPLSLEEARSFIGEGAGVLVRRMMAARELEAADHAALLEEFTSLYATSTYKASFYPGVLETLERLKMDGHSLGLCTNKPDTVTRAVIRQLGLERFFDAVVAGGMIARRKPAPDMLQATIKQLGEAGTLYIGDSEIDAETAQRAGVPFALFTRGYRKTPIEKIRRDWDFDNFLQLKEIVDSCLTTPPD